MTEEVSRDNGSIDSEIMSRHEKWFYSCPNGGGGILNEDTLPDVYEYPLGRSGTDIAVVSANADCHSDVGEQGCQCRLVEYGSRGDSHYHQEYPSSSNGNPPLSLSHTLMWTSRQMLSESIASSVKYLSPKCPNRVRHERVNSGYSNTHTGISKVVFLFAVICLVAGAGALPYNRNRNGYQGYGSYGYYSDQDHRDEIENDQDTNSEYAEEPIDMTVYLSSYGYLPKSDLETGSLRTEEELQDAIEQFQKFAGIPVTGKFDERTKEMFHKPRCGREDTEPSEGRPVITARRRHHHGSKHRRHRRYALGPSKWEKTHLTYRILNYTPDLNAREAHDAIQRAFFIWSDATQLTFEEVYFGEADINIKFARHYHSDGYPFDGPGNVLAHAFYPGEDRGGDMHFDEDERWSYMSNDGIDLLGVATHELGHSLGLAHSPVQEAIMFPWFQGNVHNLALQPDDLAGIQFLYGKGNKDTSFPDIPVTPSPTPRTRPPLITTPDPDLTTTTPNGDVAPNPCTTSVDAVALIRSEVFMFKGRWFWRKDYNGIIMNGYPAKFDVFWYGLPKDLTHFDAVYERDVDGKIVFFEGARYWMFNGNHLDHNFTEAGRPLTDFGLPKTLKKIDAVFVWGYNKQTYIISGDMYWKFIEHTGRVAFGYPRDMSMWEGVPVPVDAAFKHMNGTTYFFKDSYYWSFDDVRMKVKDRNSIGSAWLECTDSVVNRGERTDPTGSGSAYFPWSISIMVLLSSLSWYEAKL